MDVEMKSKNYTYFSERSYTGKDCKIDDKVVDYWKKVLGDNVFNNIEKVYNLRPEIVMSKKDFENVTESKEILQFSELFQTGFGENVKYQLKIGEKGAFVFDRFLDHFIKFGIAVLNEQEIDECIMDSYIDNIIRQISKISMGTLMFEMYICREQGLLVGNNSNEEYVYYNTHFLGDKKYINELFEIYPCLERMIFESIFYLVNNYKELLIRLKKDHDYLVEQLCDRKKFKKVVKMQSDISDSHKRGKTVSVLTLDNDVKVVYKPRSLKGEKAYQDFQTYISQGSKLKARTFKVIDCGNYGWEEFVESKPCSDMQQLRNYYYRFGELILQNYILNANDLHEENVIAYGEYPIVIDAETILDNHIELSKQNSREIINEKIRDSVLFSGLLPNYRFSNKGKGIDMSAIMGKEGDEYPILIPRIAEIGTFDMRRKQDAIERLAENLLHDAVITPDKHDVNWIGVSSVGSDENSTWQIQPLGNYLYEGLAGIAIFFHALCQSLKIEKYKFVCDALDQNLFTYTKEMEQKVEGIENESSGILCGEAALVYTYEILYQITKHKIYLEYARRHCEILKKTIDNDMYYDLVYGNAGAILALLNLYDLTGEEEYLRIADLAGEKLFASQQFEENTRKGWLGAGSKYPLAGFSHGVAGIAYSLVKLWSYTQKEKYLQAVVASIRFENSLYDDKIGNWKDEREYNGHKSSEQNIYMTAWCHGAAGILLSRCKIMQFDIDKELQDELNKDIKTALATTLKYGFGENDCLCHGNLGNTEILMEYGRMFNDIKTLDLCGEIREAACKRILGANYDSGRSYLYGYQIPGFMTGLSGMGYSLLRDINKELPCILSLLQSDIYKETIQQMIDKIFKIDISFFEGHASGDIQNRFNSVSEIYQFISITLISAIINAVTAIMCALVMMLQSFYLFQILFIIAAAQILIVYFLNKRARIKIKNYIADQSELQGKMVEILTNIQQIRCMRIDTILCKNIKGDYQHLIQRLKEKAQISDFIETIATTFTTISPMLLYTMGGFLIINSNLELGALVSFITLSTYFTGPFQTLSLIIPQISVLRETMLRINELMNYSDEIQSGKQSIGRFESISLKNVTFKYLGSNEPDLKGINITIKRGEKIAIVGESGSGKTTISKLLLNALTKYEGEILLNGYNINSIKREAIDHIFTIVTQVPMAISGTIRDNIDISHDLSDDEIYSCLKTAELENDVNKFPMKLNTFVGENGQNISGGQKQRIAIARALALKPEVLILDEATSNLDPITERKICDNLKKLHITQIIITHRLSQVEDADMIYVLNHGEIMEKGSHEQLMKGKGLYSKLVRIA